MVSSSSMVEGARKLVEVCGEVRAGESVLVITDFDKLPIGEAIAEAAIGVGAEVVVCLMTAHLRDGDEPPESIAAAMMSADVIYTPVSVSITHTSAVKQACNAGARAVIMTGFTRRMMEKGGLRADFHELKPICEQIARSMGNGRHVRVTTPAGTDITLSTEGRTGRALSCLVQPGEFSPVPDVEAAVSPVEGTSEGTIVADASIPYLGIGVLSEPVRFEVRGGEIVSAEGGEAATILQESWDSMGDPNVYNVAELGIGLNPECELTGEMLEDEGCWGTVHFGIGTSITLGGKVKAACHYDLLMHKTSIEVDGELILKDGEPQMI